MPILRFALRKGRQPQDVERQRFDHRCQTTDRHLLGTPANLAKSFVCPSEFLHKGISADGCFALRVCPGISIVVSDSRRLYTLTTLFAILTETRLKDMALWNSALRPYEALDCSMTGRGTKRRSIGSPRPRVGEGLGVRGNSSESNFPENLNSHSRFHGFQKCCAKLGE